MSTILKRVGFVCLVWVPSQLVWNAALGWGDEQLGRWLGITSPTVSEVYKLIVEFGPSLVVVVLAFYLYHLWWSLQSKKNPAMYQPAGGPVLTASENSSIHYTYVDNRTINIVQGALKPLQGATDKEQVIVAPSVDIIAAVKIDPRKMELLNGFNISSISDTGSGSLSVTFGADLDPKNVTAHSLSAATEVVQITTSGAEIKFDESKTDIVDVRFEFFTPVNRKFEAEFATAFNRTLFESNKSNKDAAILRLTQLRGEGVVIRNDANSLLFTSDLDAWVRRVTGWMNEVIEALRSVSVAESEWFATLDAVPGARVPIPNVRLGGEADRAMFVSIFCQHDYRLVRLERLLHKHGIGA
jgi:hypothetical protein